MRRALRSRALAVAAAVLVTVAVAGRVSSADRTRQRWGDTTAVLVARRDLPAGASPAGRDLRRVDWPDELVPDGALASAPHDRPLRVDLGEGQVLTRSHVAARPLGRWAAQLGADEAAVQVPLPAPLPGLDVGDRADLVAPSASGDPFGIDGATAGVVEARVVARSARVLEVGPDAVTVAVRREEAQRSAAAALSGPVSVVVLP